VRHSRDGHPPLADRTITGSQERMRAPRRSCSAVTIPSSRRRPRPRRACARAPAGAAVREADLVRRERRTLGTDRTAGGRAASRPPPARSCPRRRWKARLMDHHRDVALDLGNAIGDDDVPERRHRRSSAARSHSANATRGDRIPHRSRYDGCSSPTLPIGSCPGPAMSARRPGCSYASAFARR
jgi:hypothetical protein